jgi:hypothetical protein
MTSINKEQTACFFHIPKTAGSYIQQTLNTHYNYYGYNMNVHYNTNEFTLKPHFFKPSMYNNQSFFNTNPYSCKNSGIHKYYDSSPLFLKIMNLSEEKINKLFKFTFVRNPYDRFISGYNYILGFKNKLLNYEYSLDEFEKYKDIEYMIKNKNELSPIAYNHVFVTQYEHVLNKNNINDMDFIGKTENLENDLSEVLNKIGIVDINHVKKTNVNKKKHKNYKEYYTQSILDFVNEWFIEDFREFNYENFDTLDKFLE